MSDSSPTYAEASQELASAMESVDTANREFFRAFKTVVPLLALAPHPSVEALMKSWYVWNQLRTHRDKLKQQFRARYHG